MISNISFSRFFILVFTMVFLGITSCDKNDDENFNGHCENLANETRPAGDNAAIHVATAFTPNGDGLNDLFRPILVGVQSVSIKVYDENGNLVFQTTQTAGWSAPVVSKYKKYYYRIEGITHQNHKIGVCGEVYALQCFPSAGSASTFSFEDQYTGFGFTGITHETLIVCN